QACDLAALGAGANINLCPTAEGRFYRGGAEMGIVRASCNNLEALCLEPAEQVIELHRRPFAFLRTDGRHDPDGLARAMLHPRIGDALPLPTRRIEKQRHLVECHSTLREAERPTHLPGPPATPECHAKPMVRTEASTTAGGWPGVACF